MVTAVKELALSPAELDPSHIYVNPGDIFDPSLTKIGSAIHLAGSLLHDLNKRGDEMSEDARQRVRRELREGLQRQNLYVEEEESLEEQVNGWYEPFKSFELERAERVREDTIYGLRVDKTT